MRRVIGWHRVQVPLLICAMTAAASVTPCGAAERSVVFLAEMSLSERDDAMMLPILAAGEVVPDQPSSMLRRLFSTLKPIAKKAIVKAAPAPIVTAALPERAIIVAEADPNFGRWQAQANQRIEQEKSLSNRKEHAQAIAHPDSYVTVCEAGCRGKPDQIVYSVIKTEAAGAGPAPYVPTDSSAEDSTKDAVVAAAPVTSDTDITCVAGCYDSPRKIKARETGLLQLKKAEAVAVPRRAVARKSFNPARAVTVAAVARLFNKPVAPRRALQIGYNGAIVAAEPEPKKVRHAAARKAIVRAIAARLDGTSAGWRTRVIKASARSAVR